MNCLRTPPLKVVIGNDKASVQCQKGRVGWVMFRNRKFCDHVITM